MNIPFTNEQFYGVFRDYNTSMWPAQWFLFIMAVAAVVVALRPRPWSGVAVSAILGVQPDLGLIPAGLVGIGPLMTAGKTPQKVKS